MFSMGATSGMSGHIELAGRPHPKSQQRSSWLKRWKAGNKPSKRKQSLKDLSKVDGCPKSGVTVTVYGLPWKAMLMFGPAAGPVRNKVELQRFFEIITERLQRLYEVL
jgi:hypothetical protein